MQALEATWGLFRSLCLDSEAGMGSPEGRERRESGGEFLTFACLPKGPDLGGHGCWGDIRPRQACRSSSIQTEQELMKSTSVS